jgi:ABC-type tungstate transport system substrate-binding protein
MNTTHSTLLYTLVVLLIGIIMLNFKKIFSRDSNQAKSVTEAEKELIQAIHDNKLNKFKVVFEENNISPDKVCYVRIFSNFVLCG